MANYLYIKDRIINLSYLVEASLDSKEVMVEGTEQTTHQVVLYLNHPLPERRVVEINFETEGGAKEFLYYILNSLVDNIDELVDCETTDDELSDGEGETVEI